VDKRNRVRILKGDLRKQISDLAEKNLFKGHVQTDREVEAALNDLDARLERLQDLRDELKPFVEGR